MAKQNLVFLYARVSKLPIVAKNKTTNDYESAIVYLDTVRGVRAIEDNVNYVRHDHPLICTCEPEQIAEIAKWQLNDIVFIKGVVTTKTVMKSAFCPVCKDEDGNPVRAKVRSNLLYVTPIYARKVKSYGDEKEKAVEDIVQNREISNQIYVAGTLIREPKLITTKKGLQITQYQVALNRKFLIRTDNIAYKTDYPVVKSYGEKAIEDRLYLKYQSEIIVDGFLQARKVHRKCRCPQCNKLFIWLDQSMELVPYETEYVSGQKSNDEVETECGKPAEVVKQQLYNSLYCDDLSDEADSELKSADVVD